MITTIINYCTIDKRFINKCISSVRDFSNEIIISCFDHLFDGTTEDLKTLKQTQIENPDINLKIYEYKPELTLKFGSRYWHNAARYYSIQNMTKESEYILFLDADEIVDTESFIKWLSTETYKQYDSSWFACYWYFRNSKYRSRTQECCGLLTKNTDLLLNEDFMLHTNERQGILYNNNKIITNVLSLDNKPMLHHFSWVRTHEEMLSKVKSWGHNKDRNWIDCVNEEFTHEFNGKDFVHNYEYDIIENDLINFI
jgi:hypothetical protein